MSKQNFISVFGVNWKNSIHWEFQYDASSLLYKQCSYFTAFLDITAVSSYRNQQLFVGLCQYLWIVSNHTSLSTSSCYFIWHDVLFILLTYSIPFNHRGAFRELITLTKSEWDHILAWSFWYSVYLLLYLHTMHR